MHSLPMLSLGSMSRTFVLPLSNVVICDTLVSRLINGFSKKDANSFERSELVLIASNSSSTLSNVDVLDAAMYAALAYRAVRPYRSNGGRCAALSVTPAAMDRIIMAL